MKNISAAVADAGPLIHLDELAWLFVLESFETVWIPPEVEDEATRHRHSGKMLLPPTFV